ANMPTTRAPIFGPLPSASVSSDGWLRAGIWPLSRRPQKGATYEEEVLRVLQARFRGMTLKFITWALIISRKMSCSSFPPLSEQRSERRRRLTYGSDRALFAMRMSGRCSSDPIRYALHENGYGIDAIHKHRVARRALASRSAVRL